MSRPRLDNTNTQYDVLLPSGSVLIIVSLGISVFRHVAEKHLFVHFLLLSDQ